MQEVDVEHASYCHAHDEGAVVLNGSGEDNPSGASLDVPLPCCLSEETVTEDYVNAQSFQDHAQRSDLDFLSSTTSSPQPLLKRPMMESYQSLNIGEADCDDFSRRPA